jgi:transposase
MPSPPYFPRGSEPEREVVETARGGPDHERDRGIDLADRKQMLVVTDHDSKVLAPRMFRCKAWDLGAALDWAADRATRAAFAGVTVACEPTGHRWMVLAQLAAERGMSFVCVQPAASSWARKSEDLTTDKTDDKDAVLIARLTAQLRC